MGSVRVAQPGDATTLRFKSWLPEYAGGAKPVVVAGRDFTSELNGVRARPARVLCIGPDEWLIVSREVHSTNLPTRIARDLAEYGLELTDVSEELAAIELRGSLAREVLAKGCELDTTSEGFPVGRCARARIVNVDAVIDCVAETPCFELYFSRSHSSYLHSWLLNVASELEATFSQRPARVLCCVDPLSPAVTVEAAGDFFA